MFIFNLLNVTEFKLNFVQLTSAQSFLVTHFNDETLCKNIANRAANASEKLFPQSLKGMLSLPTLIYVFTYNYSRVSDFPGYKSASTKHAFIIIF